MKKNLIKKIMASTLTVFAVTAMAVPSMSVFAADTPTINAAPATVLQAATSTVGIPLKKDIVLFNVDQSQILSPNVTYSYEITTPEVNGAEITTYDPNDLNATTGEPNPGAVAQVVTVKTGVLGAVTTVADIGNTDTIKEGSISFGAENDANTNDNSLSNKKPTNSESAANVDLTKKVTGSMTITIDANKIYDTNNDNAQDNGPGVYRYKITDTTVAATLTASGITRSADYNTNNAVIYLDVYTKYNSTKDGLVVYGYVFLKDVSTTHGNESINYTAGSTETLKITGFDDDSENKDTDDDNKISSSELKSDSYHTYNVQVSKVTSGDLADTQHNFPFKVELSNDTIKSSDDFYYQITKDNNPQNAQNVSLNNAGAWSLDGITNNNTLALHNGDKIVITGLPVGTKIKVTEKNDTADKYAVSAKEYTVQAGNALTLTNGTVDATSVSVDANGTAAMNAVFDITADTVSDKIEFTNTLKDISVTGLLFNIAPFVFITAAGAVLLVLFMRNRKSSDSKSKI